METFKIVGRTNGWIAARDIHFNGKTKITLETGLSLEDARSRLDSMFNEDYDYFHDCYVEEWTDDDEPIYAIDERWTDFRDGTASYEYDSRTYSIESEDEGEFSYKLDHEELYEE